MNLRKGYGLCWYGEKWQDLFFLIKVLDNFHIIILFCWCTTSLTIIAKILNHLTDWMQILLWFLIGYKRSPFHVLWPVTAWEKMKCIKLIWRIPPSGRQKTFLSLTDSPFPLAALACGCCGWGKEPPPLLVENFLTSFLSLWHSAVQIIPNHLNWVSVWW